jgi:hypothetical protein
MVFMGMMRFGGLLHLFVNYHQEFGFRRGMASRSCGQGVNGMAMQGASNARRTFTFAFHLQGSLKLSLPDRWVAAMDWRHVLQVKEGWCQ